MSDVNSIVNCCLLKPVTYLCINWIIKDGNGMILSKSWILNVNLERSNLHLSYKNNPRSQFSSGKDPRLKPCSLCD